VLLCFAVLCCCAFQHPLPSSSSCCATRHEVVQFFGKVFGREGGGEKQAGQTTWACWDRREPQQPRGLAAAVHLLFAQLELELWSCSWNWSTAVLFGLWLPSTHAVPPVTSSNVGHHHPRICWGHPALPDLALVLSLVSWRCLPVRCSGAPEPAPRVAACSD
jgi:hypothetical protein